jgi:hypothetical protein
MSWQCSSASCAAEWPECSAAVNIICAVIYVLYLWVHSVLCPRAGAIYSLATAPSLLRASGIVSVIPTSPQCLSPFSVLYAFALSCRSQIEGPQNAAPSACSSLAFQGLKQHLPSPCAVCNLADWYFAIYNDVLRTAHPTSARRQQGPPYNNPERCFRLVLRFLSLAFDSLWQGWAQLRRRPPGKHAPASKSPQYNLHWWLGLLARQPLVVYLS